MADERSDDDDDARIGATVVGGARTHFRVWAPNRTRVEVRTGVGGEERFTDLASDGNGFFEATLDGVGPGTRYVYRLDGDLEHPDPYSRFQPDGVHGPSLVVDPSAYRWQDGGWTGIERSQLVVYETHVGTWTEAGTYAAAIERLDGLVHLGVTAVELMPVAQTPGRWNWGYDGVNLFAPRNTYGTPDDLRAFVDACHARGLGVILDVVYNHVGPEGNYLADFGPYRSPRHHTPWGDALNFDGDDSGPVRRFVIDSALRWLDEYHLDGLRLDAVHFMRDDSERTILDELRSAVTAYESSATRPIHLIAETNVLDEELATSHGDREPFSLLWCDELAHPVYAMVAPETRLTHREYRGADDLADVLRHGAVFEGAAMQRIDAARRERLARNGPMHERLFVGLQTHDLVGNEPCGRRLHDLASPETQRAAAALVLLGPWTPLIFAGEETAAASPFRFFTDFEDERLRRAVERGRRNEYPGDVGPGYVSPVADRAFEESRLGPPSDTAMRTWYRNLLAVRRDWRERGWLTATNLVVEADPDRRTFVLRYVVDATPRAFVLVRLGDGGEPSPASFAVGGTVLFDSTSSSPTATDRLEVTGVRAVVGEGDVR